MDVPINDSTQRGNNKKLLRPQDALQRDSRPRVGNTPSTDDPRAGPDEVAAQVRRAWKFADDLRSSGSLLQRLVGQRARPWLSQTSLWACTKSLKPWSSSFRTRRNTSNFWSSGAADGSGKFQWIIWAPGQTGHASCASSQVVMT